MKGVVFDVQRFAVHDGPGIRTTVFLKGCPARCEWCHNPESLSVKPQLQYYADRCINCGKCAGLCPGGAHSISEARHCFKRSLCTCCGLCASECFSNALVVSGREEDAETIAVEVLEDRAYYAESGGGVTLSGGEPVLQGDFCEALLKRLKAEGIHTALQTAGFYSFAMLERLLPYLDLVMYDIKAYSEHTYESHIHREKAFAFGNLRLLDESGVPFIVRTPCVSGVNDSVKEIESIAVMLSSLKHVRHYALIPYHGLAKVKYDILGQPFRSYNAPSKERMELLEQAAAKHVKVWNSEKGET